ncbi:hypothetical protein BDF14DRAFT_1885502 [Spinellus fusiger]|nr:hypothetical protein BDF14DRAFT_1885502 [Spinellus fusiger]
MCFREFMCTWFDGCTEEFENSEALKHHLRMHGQGIIRPCIHEEPERKPMIGAKRKRT